jgi:hypothetical protein
MHQRECRILGRRHAVLGTGRLLAPLSAGFLCTLSRLRGVARDIHHEGNRLIDFAVDRLPVTRIETELFDSAHSLTRWRFADHGRRILMDLAGHLSDDVDSVAGKAPDEIAISTYRRLALLSAAAITVRSTSAGISLIACGYTREAAGPARRVLEAKLHALAFLADSSGERARRYTQGHAGNLTRLAVKHGDPKDVEWLSRLAHADVRGLPRSLGTMPKGENSVGEGAAEMGPARDPIEANSALAWFGYECLLMGVTLASEFEVKLNLEPWIRKTIDELHGD